MDFFESQDKAKRNTGKLIFLFVLAVVSLIIVTNVLVMMLMGYSGTGMTSMAATQELRFDWGVFFTVGAFVSGVVLVGSLYKMSALRGGGARVAEMMNGRLLVSGSQDLDEQRILNVVEEMAIASGTPVPPVYLMEESGINAFAAGYSANDAVIGITRGAIQVLTREQLQGVVAHEFSHILHGDMRINIRLIGVLHGIMVLGIIGYYLLRGGAYSRRSKGQGAVMFLGLGLVVIGFVGTFFGNLIKAAVSRQREYLADASAVQFTRLPEGIAGALMQIANHSEHSYLKNPKSAEISHTLFEEGQVSSFSKLYATHPPLHDRIKAILPRWDGSYELSRPTDATGSSAAGPSAADSRQDPQERAKALLTGVAGVLVTDSLINEIGNPEAKHLDYADSVLQQISPVLLEAAREPSAARALIYFLILNDSDPTRRRQLNLLEESADIGVAAELQRLLKATPSIESAHRIPLIEIAASSLRQLSQPQYQLFKGNFNELIALDKKINLFEWALQKILFQQLDAVFLKTRSKKLRKVDIGSCNSSATTLLSVLAHATSQQGISAEDAFLAGSEKLGLAEGVLPVESISFERLNGALADLNNIKPLQKPVLLKACAACIAADGQVATIEAELMRAIAATIDCPMPPLIS